jgi:NADPH-dependent glutamate synthase beta subunit-like oxidoreductase
MIVKLAHQERFQRPPQQAGTQVRQVIRGQQHVGGILTAMDLVRTAKRKGAALDPQTLLNDLELEKMGRFNTGDALY